MNSTLRLVATTSVLVFVTGCETTSGVRETIRSGIVRAVNADCNLPLNTRALGARRINDALKDTGHQRPMYQCAQDKGQQLYDIYGYFSLDNPAAVADAAEAEAAEKK